MKSSLFLLIKKNIPLFSSSKKINKMSWISFFSIIIGTISITCTLAIINGTSSLVKKTLTTFDSDISIFNKKKKYFSSQDINIEAIKKISYVKNVNKILEETAYLEYKDNFTIAKIIGAEHYNPKLINKTKGNTNLQNANAILGLGVYNKLYVSLGDFDFIKVKIPKKKLTSAAFVGKIYYLGKLAPVGVFSVEQRYDCKYVITNLHHLQKITKNQNLISAIDISVDDDTNIDCAVSEIKKILNDDYEIKTKIEKQKLLTKALKAEKIMTVLALGVIIFIALLNLLFILSMIVFYKKNDVLILKILGETKIFSLFFFLGTLLGFTGSCIGVLISVLIFFFQNKFGVIKIGIESMLVQAYPMEIHFCELLIVIVGFTIISALVSIYPATRACKFDL